MISRTFLRPSLAILLAALFSITGCGSARRGEPITPFPPDDRSDARSR
ncbi:MAG: hypothetical protein MPW17_05720 [Candidatus Manganitrophus sp.]|nr:MAG: hypothetical protein MPW17_05720 [Candidatus Manganitrophus sp.]